LRPIMEAGKRGMPINTVALTYMPVYAYPDYTLHWVLQQMGAQDIRVVPQ